jgi:transposase, IS5 family
LFKRFDKALHDAGYIAMSGQLVDSTLVAAPKQRNSDDEKRQIKDGKSAVQIWPENPAKARQKDTSARWTVQFGKARPREDGRPMPDIAIPSFGYKAHTSIDKKYRLIRRWDVTDAAAHDGRMLRRGLLDHSNTASGVWAGEPVSATGSNEPANAYRSRKNEAFMERHGFDLPCPSSQTGRKANACEHPSRQRHALETPCANRACLCHPEAGNEPDDPNYWNRAGEGEDRHCQHRLQHQKAGSDPEGRGRLIHWQWNGQATHAESTGSPLSPSNSCRSRRIRQVDRGSPYYTTEGS